MDKKYLIEINVLGSLHHKQLIKSADDLLVLFEVLDKIKRNATAIVNEFNHKQPNP